MSTIEGGAICTDDKDLADMLRLVRAHGWDRNLSLESQTRIRNKHKVNSTFYSRYTFYALGYNLRPTEINGLLGNIQIKYLSEIIKKRNRNFLKLSAIYKNYKKYYPIEYSHIDFVSNFAAPVICKTKKIRDELVEKCNGKVEIRPIVGRYHKTAVFLINIRKNLILKPKTQTWFMNRDYTLEIILN